MGVSAGRILLIPKGDWVNDTTYEMLDWVRHNETSWVCKKNCTGIEPSEENSENWFLIAKDGEGISSIVDMIGATADTDGARGYVPAPKAGDEKKALLGDGTWGTVDAIYTFKTEEEYNQAVTNDEIPDGAKVVKEYDEQFINISVDSEMSDDSMNPVQNKVVTAEIKKIKASIEDTKDSKVTFTSNDTLAPTEFSEMPSVLASEETHASLFSKISTVFKNMRYIIGLLGSTDISKETLGIGDSTVTGAIKGLNESLAQKANIFSYGIYDANTDHNVLDNRLNAIKDAIESIGIDKIKYFSVISIRYYGGIYATYLITKESYNTINVFEYSCNFNAIRIYEYLFITKEIIQIKEL